jgi:DNA-binding transcriptional regulator LsrR (DeoR family)
MALNEKRVEAERLYVEESLTVTDIAAKLDVNEGTVYRWKQEAADKGENTDWDELRRTYNMSPRQLVAIYSKALRQWVVSLQKTPELLADGKIADAMAKHVSVLQKLDTRGQYLGVVTDFIKVENQWLEKNHPEIKKELDPLWDALYQEFVNYSTSKGLF